MKPRVTVTCAVTGTRDTFRQNSAVPITPAQIAASSIEAAAAGAAIVHLHVRDPETGGPSGDLSLYRETVERIREGNGEVLINLTTGTGSRLNLADDLAGVAPGTRLAPPEERVGHVLDLRPELCSLDIGTMSVGDSVRLGTPKQMRAMTRLIREAGAKPEVDVFDTGNLVLARELIREGEIPGPPLFQFVLGAKWGAPATTATVLHFKGMLPPDAIWSAMGVGSEMYPMLAQAALLGGNVRVGLEDDIYLEPGVLAPSNAAIVERAVRLLALLGIDVASPAEARATLGL